MIKNKEYKKQVLSDNYRQVDNSDMTHSEYAENESGSDPMFFTWLFGEDKGDFGNNMTDEEQNEFSDFLSEL